MPWLTGALPRSCQDCCIRFHSRHASSKLWPSEVRFWQFLHSSQPKEPSAPTWTVPAGRSPHVEHGRMLMGPPSFGGSSGSRLILPLLSPSRHVIFQVTGKIYHRPLTSAHANERCARRKFRAAAGDRRGGRDAAPGIPEDGAAGRRSRRSEPARGRPRPAPSGPAAPPADGRSAAPGRATGATPRRGGGAGGPAGGGG